MIKKILILALLLFVFGCATKDSANAKIMNFVGEKDKSFRIKLVSYDDFDTVIMTDHKGRSYHLKNAVTASGVRFANDKVEIAFKKGEGIVNLGKKDVFVRSVD